MKGRRDTITVRVPGSTSNCGAGFDTLGLALSLHNYVTLTRLTTAEIEAERPADARALAMVTETAALFYRTAALPPAGFRYRIEGEVPSARGLGSSVTVIAGVLNILVIYDAIAGPAFRVLPSQEDETAPKNSETATA